MQNISHNITDMVELVTFDNGFLIACANKKANPMNITNEYQRQECIRYKRQNPLPDIKLYPRYGKYIIVCYVHISVRSNYFRNYASYDNHLPTLKFELAMAIWLPGYHRGAQRRQNVV